MEPQSHTPAPQAPAPAHPETAHNGDKKPEATRAAALNGLAFVGFLALIFLGITLAIYSARYIPQAVSKLATASEVLSGSKNGSTTPTLSVVSGTTTIPFGGTDTTGNEGTDGSTGTQTVPLGLTPIVTTAPTHTPAPAPTPRTHVAPYGLPDLQTSALTTGYLANGTNDSFVAAQVIPAGARAAVRFSVTNVGTNATGNWGFIAQLPESEGYVFTSPVEQNMNPGDHIVFTLGFDQVHIAPGPQVVTVQADPADQIPEIRETNNSASSAFQVAAY